MTTQEQKDKKIEVAVRQADAAQAKLTKAEERLAGLEAEYAETKAGLVAKIDALRPEVATAVAHVEWVRGMPVSGKASGEVGAVETPIADGEEDAPDEA